MLLCLVYSCAELRSKIPTLSERVNPTLSHPLTLLHPVFRTLFQVPYPVSPAFATLTKTAGVWGYSSHFGKVCAVAPTRSRISFKLFLFTFLRTLLHAPHL